MAHIHADLMRQYANDAIESDTPWENWEFFSEDNQKWVQLVRNPYWDIETQYRRKEKYTVDYDDNLNTAGWEFIEIANNYGLHSPILFNNSKIILREVIQNYLNRMSVDDKKKLV